MSRKAASAAKPRKSASRSPECTAVWSESLWGTTTRATADSSGKSALRYCATHWLLTGRTPVSKAPARSRLPSRHDRRAIRVRELSIRGSQVIGDRVGHDERDEAECQREDIDGRRPRRVTTGTKRGREVVCQHGTIVPACYLREITTFGSRLQSGQSPCERSA
jgi:hypothetical protein